MRIGTLTVRELRERLEDLSDDTPVVLVGPNHAYRKISLAYKDTAGLSEGGVFSQYGEGGDPGERPISVVVID